MDTKTKVGTMESKGKATLSYGGDKTLDFPVYGGTIGPDVIDIRQLYGKTGMFTYDPGFLSTASCRRRSRRTSSSGPSRATRWCTSSSRASTRASGATRTRWR
jgi:hypothetical protein